MNVKHIILLSITALFPALTNAQNWTLKQCIERASALNLSIKKQVLQTQSSDVSLGQAKNDRLPTLTGYAEQNLNYGMASTDLNGSSYERKMYPSGQVGVTSELNLWNGGKTRNSIKKQTFLADASRLTEQSTLQEVVLYVTSDYLDVVYQLENVKILETQTNVTAEQVKRTTILVDAGTLPRHELSLLQMQQAQEKADIIKAKNQVKLSLLVLGQLLELAGDSLKNFAVETPIIGEIDNMAIDEPDTIYSRAAGFYPELKAQSLVVESYTNDLTVARADGLPRVYLQGQLYTNYNGVTYKTDEPTVVKPYGNQASDNVFGVVTLGVSIPIFNRHLTRSNVAQSHIAQSTAQIVLEEKKKTLYNKTQSSWIEATSAKEQYLARVEARKLAQESFDLAQEQYNAGTLSGISFIIEKNNLVNAESDLLVAKYQLIFKLKLIDVLQGKYIGM